MAQTSWDWRISGYPKTLTSTSWCCLVSDGDPPKGPRRDPELTYCNSIFPPFLLLPLSPTIGVYSIWDTKRCGRQIPFSEWTRRVVVGRKFFFLFWLSSSIVRLSCLFTRSILDLRLWTLGSRYRAWREITAAAGMKSPSSSPHRELLQSFPTWLRLCQSFRVQRT